MYIEPNNATAMQIGWTLGDEFEYVVLGDQYYLERIGAVITVVQLQWININMNI